MEKRDKRARAGTVWLVHPDRLRLGEEWRQQFLISNSAALLPVPQYHSVWCWNHFTPSNWAQWVDVQTNVDIELDPLNAWRTNTLVQVVCPEAMVEILR